ncbi:MAG: SulP family inorganic anion transporter [Vampirovibrionales bacterium]
MITLTTLPSMTKTSFHLRQTGLPKPHTKFSWDTLRKDGIAGTVTGLMAIPLTIGICLMSEYPIQTGLYTVVFACLVGFLVSLFKKGNYTGTPGIAAGLAPVLALGIHEFGASNMPFLIFMTSFFQFLVWRGGWEKYILKAVPAYLVEGLLAGVGVKIFLKFLPYTYTTLQPELHTQGVWLTQERLYLIGVSAFCAWLFFYLFNKFKKTSPGIPYIVTILASVFIAQYVQVPMLHIEHLPLMLKLPIPHIDAHHPSILLHMLGYAVMLASIDVIEQVMSNVAIEKLDPLKRPTNSNNSLLAIWIANMGSSFFGGMTNLDGLAKSTTNTMAGAVTKVSNVFTAGVLLFFGTQHYLLEHVPEFSLAVLMLFSGWKMIVGILHVAESGKYAFMLSVFCALFVWKHGIFEGLLIALAIHVAITYVIDRHHKTPLLDMIKKFTNKFVEPVMELTLEHTVIETDELTGGKRYRSIRKLPSDQKSLTLFIREWGHAINSHNLLQIVNHYDYDALLWGTFAIHLGSGHIPIKTYFEHLLELEALQVTFQAYETRSYGDIFIQSGTYEFSHLKKGVRQAIPARYSFVCKKYKNSWCILEHHSSEFPA